MDGQRQNWTGYLLAAVNDAVIVPRYRRCRFSLLVEMDGFETNKGVIIGINLEESGGTLHIYMCMSRAASFPPRTQPCAGQRRASSCSQTVAVASLGARQSERGDSAPPEPIVGPFGKALRLN